MYIDLYIRGEARPLSHLADDLNCGGLTRVQRAARNKGSSLPVTSFANLGPPPSPEVKIRSVFNSSSRNNSKFLNFHKSFSLGNYYRQEEEEEPKVKKIIFKFIIE
jgi:hypothetical protein